MFAAVEDNNLVDGAVKVATPSLSVAKKSYRAIKTRAQSTREHLTNLLRLVS
jgi:hypothetical protein